MSNGRLGLGVAILVVIVAGGALLLSSDTEKNGDRPVSVRRAAAVVTSPASRPQWQTVGLAYGKRNGVLWGMGAKVARNQGLERICVFVTTVNPPPPNSDVAESRDTSSCGRIAQPKESVSVVTKLGASEGTAVPLFATVYAPAVRRVVFELAGGGQKVVRTKLRKAMRPKEKGAPLFRYIAFFLDPGACAERIVTYDHAGAVIAREDAAPGC